MSSPRLLMLSLTLLVPMGINAAEPSSAAGGDSGTLSKEATAAGPAVDTSTMSPASPAANPPAPQKQPSSPAANAKESSPAQPSRRGAAVTGSQAASSRAGSDRLNLDTTRVTGNSELPKVMYIVPWKRSDLGDLPAQPFNTLLDEALAPVDRDVFRREVTYYGAVSGAGKGVESAPASQAERSEK